MGDLDLIGRLEEAARHGWPAAIQRAAPGGWVLRATPGLDRGRSNNALPPCRRLDEREIEPAIERVNDFAHEHSIRPGIQVSPLGLHDGLRRYLDNRGWTARWPTIVLTGPVPATAPPVALIATDHADEAWLRAWARGEPGRDVDAHAATVFELLRGRACFARIGLDAVGIAVPHERLVGMFCIAVDPERRRAGLGTAIVAGLLTRTGSRAQLAYLQVDADNEPARAMYGRLGFSEAYRYCHQTA